MAENYSQKSFPSIYEDLLSFVENSSTRWKPRNSTEADPGVVILKLIAMLEDKHGYRFDMAMNQNYLDGISDRQSAYELLKELGYLMKQARAATGYIELIPDYGWKQKTVNDVVLIPRFTVITDGAKNLKYFTTEETLFMGKQCLDETTQNVKNVNFRIKVQAGEPFPITKDGYDYFTLKDVDEQGRLYLGKSGLAQNGIFLFTVSPDDEEKYVSDWTYLDFAILKPRGKWYEVQTAESGEMYIQFPSNFEELIKTSKLKIRATYTTGSASNVSSGTLSTFEDSDFKPLFAIKQKDDIYSGQDEESIETAKNNYYATKDICNTLVTKKDFESAIRHLLVSLTDGNLFKNRDERYFSNVIVHTAADRRTNVRTRCKDTEYTLFVPDKGEPSNQIDVIAMQYSDDYVDSFKQVTDLEKVEFIEADIAQQLKDNVAVDTEVKIDTKNTRLLAVTSPSIRIRVSNYSMTLDTQLRQKIQKYFYSKYKADNLVAGEPLDFQTIVDDIKAMSPNITSVSMSDLKYDVYSKYLPVDGVEEEEKVSSASEMSSSEKVALTELSELQLDTLARSVLQGDVPLFRFYNRQNTLSKQASAYALLASSARKSEDFETVIPVPPNSSQKEGGSFPKDDFISPKLVSYSFQTDNAYYKLDKYKNEDAYKSCIPSDADDIRNKNDIMTKIVSSNQLLQFRAPLFIATDTYGYGMEIRYTCSETLSSMMTVTNEGTLAKGCIIGSGSKLCLNEGDVIKVGDGIELESEGCYNFKAARKLTKSVDIKAGTKLASGSVLVSGTVVDEKKIEAVEIKKDKPCVLESWQEIVIRNSKGEVQRTFREGDSITLSFDLKPSDEYSQLSTNQTVSANQLDISTISTDFTYFLSLRTESENGIFELTSDGYMLEEGEVFVYADKGVTEYIILGPGTLLKPSKGGSIKLRNVPNLAVEEINQNMFESIPAEIIAQAFEFSTFEAPCWVSYSQKNNEGDIFSNTWTPIHADARGQDKEGGAVYVVSEEAIPLDNLFEESAKGTVIKSGNQHILAEFSTSRKVEVRSALRLQSTNEGVALVEYPCNMEFSYKAKDGSDNAVTVNAMSEGADAAKNSYLLSTTPFAGVFAGSLSGVSLLGEGLKARMSQIEVAASVGIKGIVDVTIEPTKLVIEFLGEEPASDKGFSVSFPLIDNTRRIVAFNVDMSQLSGIKNAMVTFSGKDESSVYRAQDVVNFFAESTASTVTLDANSKDKFGVSLMLVPKHSEQNSTLYFDLSTLFSKMTEKDFPELKGKKIEITNISYIENYATELGIEGSLYANGELNRDSISLIEKVIELDTERRFNWLALPTEKYTKPLTSEAILLDGHPLKDRVFSYVDLINADIVVTKER